MFGFFIGFACLIGLIAVLRRGRGYGCGHGLHSPRGRHRRRHHHHDHDPDDEAGFGGFRGPRVFLRWLFERLDTTPGQEKEIRAAVEELVSTARSLKGEGRSSREDIAKLLRTETLDEDVLGGLFSRHDDRLRELQKAFADALGRIHLALDPEQRERLAELIEKQRGRGFGGPYRGWA